MKKTLLLLSFTTWVATTIAQTTLQVLVNSRATHSIQKYDANGNYLGDFITPNSGGLSAPEDIVFHPDGTVLVTGANNAAIKRYDGTTGTFIGNFSTGYALNIPSKMSIGPDSLLYVTQWGGTADKVIRFNLQGAYVDEFTKTGVPKGLSHVWDKKKNFYIAAYGNGADGYIHRFDSLGNDMGVFINSAIIQGPTNIWFDTNGDLLVADWTLGKVHCFDSGGVYKNDFVTGLTNPEGLAFLPNGQILMGDWGLDKVHLINSNGTLAATFCTGNGLADPNCVRVRTVPTTGIATLTKNSISVTPTVGERFNIQVQSANAPVAVHVINTYGQIITGFTIHQSAEWDASSCPAGIYIIRANTKGVNYMHKVVVAKE